MGATCARALAREFPRGLYLQGLAVCGLLEDLARFPAATLLAPQDEAFEELPWSYRELLTANERIEELFDLIEYTVLRGHHHVAPSRRVVHTLQGAAVCLESARVAGIHDTANIQRTVLVGHVLIHVVDRCILPMRPGPIATLQHMGRTPAE